MLYEYKVSIRVGDVNEDFYFDSNKPDLTKKDITDNMVVLKRKVVRETPPDMSYSDNEAVNKLKNIFGIK